MNREGTTSNLRPWFAGTRHAAQQLVDLAVRPVAQDSGDNVQIGLREAVFEKVAWQEADLLRARSVGLETRDVLEDLWEVEHGHPEPRVLPGERVGQGARAASQVAGGAEAGQVEGRGHVACGQLGQAVHGPQEPQPRLLAVGAGRLARGSRPLAQGPVVGVDPVSAGRLRACGEVPGVVAVVQDEAAEGVRPVRRQVQVGRLCVAVTSVRLLQEPQGHAGVQQPSRPTRGGAELAGNVHGLQGGSVFE